MRWIFLRWVKLVLVEDAAQAVLTLTQQELIHYCENITTHVVRGMFENGAINPGVLCRWCQTRMSATACRNHQPRCEMNPKVIARKERLERIAKYTARPLS